MIPGTRREAVPPHMRPGTESLNISARDIWCDRLRAEHPASAESESFTHSSVDTLRTVRTEQDLPAHVAGVNVLALASLQMRSCCRSFPTTQNIYQKKTSEQLMSWLRGETW